MRRLVAFLALLAVCAGCGPTKHKEIVVSAPAPQGDGVPLNPPTAAPAFLLHDQSGKLVGPQLEKGHWTVVTFLYTHCPDVCPLIANNLGAAQRQNADLRVIAVSVDPKGDTHAAVERFIAKHRLPAAFSYVAGSRAQLAPVWKKYNIAAQPGPNGVVSHSSYTVLIDPTGRERVLYDSQITAAAVLHDVKTLS